MFDPTKPAENTPLDAAEMRNQFNGLNAFIADKASHSEVQNAIADTARNMNSVADLSIGLSNPPQSNEVQTIVDKINELLAALRR